MIYIAITAFCKNVIIEYFKLYSKEYPKDQLNIKDWKNLKNIWDFLAKFSKIIMDLQGFKGTAILSSTLCGIEFILEVYEQATVKFAADPFLLSMFNSG